MSKYEEQLEKLKDHICKNCEGEGFTNDAELGDIAFNTYKCTNCDGTGFELGVTIHLYKAVPDGGCVDV